MSKKLVRAYNTVNGLIVNVPESYFNRSEYLYEASDEDVPYDPALYTPKTAKEFQFVHNHRRITEPAVEVEEDEVLDNLDNEQEI